MLRPLLAALLFLLVSLIAVTPFATDYSWSPNFAYQGFNGRVCSAVIFQGDLVAIGRFTANGAEPTTDIARWDGAQWLSMGDPGFSNEGGFALGVYQNELYASGFGVFGLLKWNGLQWFGAVPFDYQSAPALNNMVEYNGLLMVAGFFTAPGAWAIGGWNGSGWVSLGDQPLLHPADGPFVYDMVVYNGDLIVAGDFSQSEGGTPMNGLARWDGTTWRGVEGRSAPAQPLLEGLHSGTSSGAAYALAVHQGKVAIGGRFLTAGDLPAVNVVTFDSSTELWGNIGSAPDSVIAMSSNDVSLLATVRHSPLYGFDLREYDGSSWSSVGISDGPNVHGIVSAMVAYNGEHVLVSEFHDIDGAPTPSIATWDGTTVGTLANPTSGSGLPRSVVAMTEHDGELIVAIAHGGRFNGGAHGILAFDGTSWRYIARWVDNSITHLASDGSSLYVSGRLSEIESLPVSTVARWDGTTWHSVGSISYYTDGLAIHSGTLYAGSAATVWCFNGSAWVSISAANEGGSAMTSYDGKLVTSGSVRRLSSWDGATWTPLTGVNGGTLNGRVLTFAEFNGNLVMVGYFNTVDGVPAQVAVWDGTSLAAWMPSALPDPATTMSSVASFDGRIVVAAHSGGAGLWESSGPGLPWQVLAGGLDGHYPELQTFNGRLYVGGEFGVVGDQTGQAGVVSSNIACLAPTPTGLVAEPTAFGTPVTFPNPFNPTTTIRYTVPAGGAHVRISIHDVSGRTLRTAWDGRADEGERFVTWDGRDDDGNAVASGTYFYRINVANEVFTGKLTLLK